MKRTFAALIATTLVACQSAESDPDNAMLADAQITETPDAAPPDAPLPPPPPTMARVRVSVAGAPLNGAPVVFHGPDGVPLATTATDADGVAVATVPAGAMVTVVDQTQMVPVLTTFVGVAPGDDLAVQAQPPAGTVRKASVTFPTLAGRSLYTVSAGCHSVAVDLSALAALPATAKGSMELPAACVVDGAVRFHVLAGGDKSAWLSVRVPVAEDDALVSADLTGVAWTPALEPQTVRAINWTPAAYVGVISSTEGLDGHPYEFVRANGTLDGDGKATLSVLAPPPSLRQHIFVRSVPKAPSVIGAAANPIVKYVEMDGHYVSPWAEVTADLGQITGSVTGFTSEGAGDAIAAIPTIVGDGAGMTGSFAEIRVRNADDVIYSWNFILPPGASIKPPTLPDGLAVHRPVTWAPRLYYLERGPWADHAAYRHTYGRPLPAVDHVVYRSAWVYAAVVPPTPAPQ